MKLLIASDIHGSAYHCSKLLEIFHQENPEKLILLGDVLYHGPRNALPKEYAPAKVAEMLSEIKESIVAVRGNCDSEVDQMVLPFPCMADYSTLMVDGQLMYLTHGHLSDPDHLPPIPVGTVFLSGHTHVKTDYMKNGVRCVNPGSVSIPKDCSHSCMIWDNGELRTIIWEAEE